jgi:hypothetical protein
MEVSDDESSLGAATTETFTRTNAQHVEQTTSVDGGGVMKRQAGASAAGAEPAAQRRGVEAHEPAGSVASSAGGQLGDSDASHSPYSGFGGAFDDSHDCLMCSTSCLRQPTLHCKACNPWHLTCALDT